MRSLHIDQNSVAFLTEEDKSALRRFAVLRPYLDAKKADIERWNAGLKERGEDPVNQRELTNLGTFRAYVQAYLEHHPGVRQDMTLLVRQLQRSEEHTSELQSLMRISYAVFCLKKKKKTHNKTKKQHTTRTT